MRRLRTFLMLKFYPCRNSKARLKPSARKFKAPDRLAPSLARIHAPYRPQIIPLRQLRGTFCSVQAKPRAKTHPSQEILSPTEFQPPASSPLATIPPCESPSHSLLIFHSPRSVSPPLALLPLARIPPSTNPPPSRGRREILP